MSPKEGKKDKLEGRLKFELVDSLTGAKWQCKKVIF